MATPSGYIGPPITTHTWLKPLYSWLKGVGQVPLTASGTAVGAQFGRTVPVTDIGNATGIIGFYGATGIVQAATGLGNTGGATGQSFYDLRSNGGSGSAFYTFTDVIAILKQAGFIKN